MSTLGRSARCHYYVGVFLVQVLSGEVKEPSGYCVCCRKNFNNRRAYENHLNSKKHKQTAAQFDAKTNKVTEHLPIAFFPEFSLASLDFQVEIANNRLNRKPSESDAAAVPRDDHEDEEDEEEIEEVDSDEWDEFSGGEAVPSTDCIFCLHHSK